MRIEVPWATAQYHRCCLSSNEKHNYDRLLEGIRSFQQRIHLAHPILSEEANRLYLSVVLDHPIFYHVSSSFSVEGGGIWLCPDYVMNEETYRKCAVWVRAELKRLSQIGKGLPVDQRLLLLHDRIVRSINYGNENQCGSHTIYGALNRVAVCEGISKLFKVLCDIWRIPSTVVVGRSEQGGVLSLNRYAEEAEINHSWNICCINGRYYNVDPTFDLNLSSGGQARKDYFLRADSMFLGEHKPFRGLTGPLCPEDRSFYVANHLCVRQRRDVERLLCDLQQTGQRSLVFEIEPAVTVDRAIDWVKRSIERFPVHTYTISLNAPMRIIELNY